MKLVKLSLVMFFSCLATLAIAADVKGTVRKVEANKDTITVEIDGKQKAFKVNLDTKYQTVTLTRAKKEVVANITDGLGGIKEGYLVTVTTDDDGKVTNIKVTGQEEKKKKK